jgi:hypothetical protein
VTVTGVHHAYGGWAVLRGAAVPSSCGHGARPWTATCATAPATTRFAVPWCTHVVHQPEGRHVRRQHHRAARRRPCVPLPPRRPGPSGASAAGPPSRLSSFGVWPCCAAPGSTGAGRAGRCSPRRSASAGGGFVLCRSSGACEQGGCRTTRPRMCLRRSSRPTASCALRAPECGPMRSCAPRSRAVLLPADRRGAGAARAGGARQRERNRAVQDVR